MSAPAPVRGRRLRGPRRSALPALARLAALVAALTATGCAGLRTLVAPAPQGSPTDRPGWLAWEVAGLRFEAPAGWTASGDARRLTLAAGGEARLEAVAVEAAFPDQKACLSAAEDSLARGAAQLSRVRRHLTTLAGRPAVLQEADAGGWHGWAYAVCGPSGQHRLSFSGRSPVPADLLDAWRAVVKSARLGGAHDGA